MARSEQDAACRFIFANHVGRGGRGENGALTDDEFGDPVGCCDAEDYLDGRYGKVATVPTDDER